MNDSIEVYLVKKDVMITFDKITHDAYGQIRIERTKDEVKVFDTALVKELHDNGFEVYVYPAQVGKMGVRPIQEEEKDIKTVHPSELGPEFERDLRAVEENLLNRHKESVDQLEKRMADSRLDLEGKTNGFKI